MTIGEARQLAFSVLSNHGDCLRDDYPMNDLIEEIAEHFLILANRNTVPLQEQQQ